MTFLRTLADAYIRYATSREQENKKQTPRRLVGKRTVPTNRPPLVGEINANFCG
jgi:hypothetical protein